MSEELPKWVEELFEEHFVKIGPIRKSWYDKHGKNYADRLVKAFIEADYLPKEDVNEATEIIHNMVKTELAPAMDELIGNIRRIVRENESYSDTLDKLQAQLNEKDKEIIDLKKEHKKLIEYVGSVYKVLHGSEMDKNDIYNQIINMRNLAGNLLKDKATLANRIFRMDAEWEVKKLDDGSYYCSWKNPETKKLEDIELPAEFNPHNPEKLKYDKLRENCTIRPAGFRRDFKIATSLLEKLEEFIPRKPKRKIPIEDLPSICEKLKIKIPIRLTTKKVWSALVGEKDLTISTLSTNSGVSKQKVYDIIYEFMNKDLALKKGNIVNVHPRIYDVLEDR